MSTPIRFTNLYRPFQPFTDMTPWGDDLSDFETLRAVMYPALKHDQKPSAEEIADKGIGWGCIYCHRCLADGGKRYIGRTAQAWDVRWRQHVNDAIRFSDFSFHVAIRKFGARAFEHSILNRVPESDLATEEDFWIDALQTRNPAKGYNGRQKGKA